MYDVKLPTVFVLISGAVFAVQAAVTDVAAMASDAVKDSLRIGATADVYAAHAELSWEDGVQAALAATSKPTEPPINLLTFETVLDAETIVFAELDSRVQ